MQVRTAAELARITGHGNGVSGPDRAAHGFQQGGIVLNITQCNAGSVHQGLYKSSSMFNEVGVIVGSDLTSEAAVTKMMIVLGNIEKEFQKEMLKSSIRGELSEV